MDARDLLPLLEGVIALQSEHAVDARKRVQVMGSDDDCALLLLLPAVMTAKAMQLASLVCIAHEISAWSAVVRSLVVTMRKSLYQCCTVIQSLRMLGLSGGQPPLDAVEQMVRD